MRPQPREAHFKHIALAAAGVEDGAATALSVRVYKRVDRRLEAFPRQRLEHEATLPVAIALRFPVLQRAAAAGAEVRTDRRDALGACDLDLDQSAAIGMALPGVDLGGLAW